MSKGKRQIDASIHLQHAWMYTWNIDVNGLIADVVSSSAVPNNYIWQLKHLTSVLKESCHMDDYLAILVISTVKWSEVLYTSKCLIWLHWLFIPLTKSTRHSNAASLTSSNKPTLLNVQQHISGHTLLHHRQLYNTLRMEMEHLTLSWQMPILLKLPNCLQTATQDSTINRPFHFVELQPTYTCQSHSIYKMEAACPD